MPDPDGVQPAVPASPAPPRAFLADPRARARRRAQVLRRLALERRRQRQVEPRVVRWTGTETA
jgi:hypothetical protein